MSKLTLKIEALAQKGLKSTIFSGERQLGRPTTISPAMAADVRELGQRFRGLFEGTIPLVRSENLRQFGQRLRDVFFTPVWEKCERSSGRLLIVSADREMLTLPWELIELNEGTPLGCDTAWSLRRTSVESFVPPVALIRGPLRVLFMTACPVDQELAEIEREEDIVLEATAHADLRIHFAERGSIDELAALVTKHRPHLVHLSGQCGMDDQESAIFAFEDERGRTDWQKPKDLYAKVLRDKSVRCLLLNARWSPSDSIVAFCQALLDCRTPYAIGWPLSPADERASGFLRTFYGEAAKGTSITNVVALARNSLREAGKFVGPRGEVQDPVFALPQVYCSVESGELFDSSRRADSPEFDQVPEDGHQHALLGSIPVLRFGFIDRRREYQRLLRALREGDATVGAITGIQGVGKSVLATKVATRLQQAGFEVVTVSTKEGPIPSANARNRSSFGRCVCATAQSGHVHTLESARNDTEATITDHDARA